MARKIAARGVVLALGVAALVPFGGLWGGFTVGDRRLVVGVAHTGAANFARIASIIARISGVATNFPVLIPSVCWSG